MTSHQGDAGCQVAQEALRCDAKHDGGGAQAGQERPEIDAIVCQGHQPSSAPDGLQQAAAACGAGRTAGARTAIVGALLAGGCQQWRRCTPSAA